MKTKKLLAFFSQNKSVLWLVLMVFLLLFFLIYRGTTTQEENSSLSNMSLPENKNPRAFYKTKMEAYKAEKRRKEAYQEKAPLKIPFFSFDEPPIIENLPKDLKEDHTPPKPIQVKPFSAKRTPRPAIALPSSQEELENLKKDQRRKALEAFHEKKATPPKEKEIIKAQINHNQIISNGKEIAFHLLEDLLIEGVTIPAYSQVYGRASFSSFRILVDFNSIVYQDQIFPFKRSLYDFDGFLGISVDSNEALEKREENIEQEVLSADGYVTPFKGSGAILKGVNSLKKVFIKEKKITVELLSGHRVLLKKNKLKETS